MNVTLNYQDIFGLPKIHKVDIFMQPVKSVIASAHYRLGKMTFLGTVSHSDIQHMHDESHFKGFTQGIITSILRKDKETNNDA